MTELLPEHIDTPSEIIADTKQELSNLKKKINKEKKPKISPEKIKIYTDKAEYTKAMKEYKDSLAVYAMSIRALEYTNKNWPKNNIDFEGKTSHIRLDTKLEKKNGHIDYGYVGDKEVLFISDPDSRSEWEYSKYPHIQPVGGQIYNVTGDEWRTYMVVPIYKKPTVKPIYQEIKSENKEIKTQEIKAQEIKESLMKPKDLIPAKEEVIENKTKTIEKSDTNKAGPFRVGGSKYSTYKELIKHNPAMKNDSVFKKNFPGREIPRDK